MSEMMPNPFDGYEAPAVNQTWSELGNLFIVQFKAKRLAEITRDSIIRKFPNRTIPPDFEAHFRYDCSSWDAYPIFSGEEAKLEYIKFAIVTGFEAALYAKGVVEPSDKPDINSEALFDKQDPRIAYIKVGLSPQDG